MPILDDIIDHEVLGLLIRKGLQQRFREGFQEGYREGFKQGIEMGWKKGVRGLPRGQLKKRFGKLPKWVEPRLTQMPVKELCALGLRLLDASSLNELFPQQ